MALRFQPPPTHIPTVEIDEFGVGHFSPIWLKWLIDLTRPLGGDATTTITIEIDDDYTIVPLAPHVIIVCTNATPITLTLAVDVDKYMVTIKRQNALVTLKGDGNTMDGELTKQIGNRYDAPSVVWTDNGGEYSFV
jgi:hypothetical protein